jgi:hypothetical protein
MERILIAVFLPETGTQSLAARFDGPQPLTFCNNKTCVGQV